MGGEGVRWLGFHIVVPLGTADRESMKNKGGAESGYQWFARECLDFLGLELLLCWERAVCSQVNTL
jgi:hypothetical protein